MVSCRSCKLFLLFFILFTCFSSNWVISRFLSFNSMIRSSIWSILMLTFSTAFSFYSLNSSALQFLSGSFQWFLSFCYIFLLCVCIVFLILLNCLSIFSCGSLTFFKTAILNSLLVKSQIIALGSVTGGWLWLFDGIMVPWFFMILGVLHCHFCIWSSSCLLQYVIAAFR